jgi:hypothetical protein
LCRACRAISSLAAPSSEARAALGGAGAARPLVAALSRHANDADPTLLRRVCCALDALAFHSAANRAAITAASPFVPLVAALMRHADDARLVKWATNAVGNIADAAGEPLPGRVSSGNDAEAAAAGQRRDIFIAASVEVPLVSLLTRHAGDADAVGALCYAVCRLTDPGPAAAAEACHAFHQTGVIPPLAAALSAHSSNDEVATYACQAVGNLADGHGPRAKALAAAGVAPVLLGILSRAIDAPDVVFAPCNAISGLASDEATADTLHCAGAAPLLLAAIARWPADEVVVAWAPPWRASAWPAAALTAAVPLAMKRSAARATT